MSDLGPTTIDQALRVRAVSLAHARIGGGDRELAHLCQMYDALHDDAGWAVCAMDLVHWYIGAEVGFWTGTSTGILTA